MDHFERQEEVQRAKDLGIYINFLRPTVVGNQKFWALDDIYLAPSPSSTFHDFILNGLVETLGRNWWEEQEKKSAEDQHFIVRAYRALDERKQDNAYAQVVGAGVKKFTPDGLGQYALSLAFDIATLRRTLSLPDRLVTRLRRPDHFQGARYEVAVASIFARIGCEIEYQDHSSKKHPEFIATFGPTQERIAVEAKSRHRPGVLNFAGQVDWAKVRRGGLGTLVAQALEQDPGDLAFIVFVDVNTPPGQGLRLEDTDWYAGVREVVERPGPAGPDNPDPYSAIVFTNYSYHYERGAPVSGPEGVTVLPKFPRDQLSESVRERLHQAISHYGAVPTIEPLESTDS